MPEIFKYVDGELFVDGKRVTDDFEIHIEPVLPEVCIGPLPQCRECGVVWLGLEPRLCEHGVIPGSYAQFTITFQTRLVMDQDGAPRRIEPRGIEIRRVVEDESDDA